MRLASRLRVLPALILLTSCSPPPTDDLAAGSVESTESAAHGANDWYELRLQIVDLVDAAGPPGPDRTTPAQISDFVNHANNTLRRARVRFRFNPATDWATLVDADLNNNLVSNNTGNWERANRIADRYPGRVVMFLRAYTPSNFAFVPPTGQAIPRDCPTPSPFPRFIAFMNNSGGAQGNRDNFVHELGHFLGLYHTHLSYGGGPAISDEAVARLHRERGRSGTFDGDLIADTPEDPGAVFWAYARGWRDGVQCQSDKASVTVDGKTYRPDRSNVMSYFGCGATITAGQAAAIRRSLSHSSRRALTHPPCSPDFHGLRIESFQACFDYWVDRDLWPQTLSVSPDGRRISGSFQRQPFRGEVRTLMSLADFDNRNRRHVAGNWLPRSVSSTQDGRFTAIWEPGGGPVISVRNVDEGAFNAAFARNFQNRYVLRDWFIIESGGALRMHASWVQAGFNGNAAYYGLSWADFQSRNDEFGRQGLKVTHFLAYQLGGQTAYAAIWAPASGNRVVTVSTSSADYQTVYNNQSRAGMRLHQVHMFGADGYAAVWTN